MINCRNFLQLNTRLQDQSTVQREIFARRLHGFAEKFKPKLSQAEIARRLDINPAVVGNWFQARNLPETAILPSLAVVLKCSIDELFCENSSSRESPIVGEGQVARYNSTPVEKLKAEIRGRFDDTLSLAGDNISRLGWIAEQMNEHLAVPKNWRPTDGTALVRVSLPSQTTALSAETGLPLPTPSQSARSA